jgi:hypothetical protein
VYSAGAAGNPIAPETRTAIKLHGAALKVQRHRPIKPVPARRAVLWELLENDCGENVAFA